MNFFGQRDKRWAQVKLGKTNRTLAQVGCTTCCIADATSYLSGVFNSSPIVKETNPATLAQRLDYTKDALLIWESLKKVNLRLFYRFRTFDRKAIDSALKSPIQVVALNVDNGGHWVFALKAIPFTNSYWVHDPWSNSKKIYSGVVGGAVLTKL